LTVGHKIAQIWTLLRNAPTSLLHAMLHGPSGNSQDLTDLGVCQLFQPKRGDDQLFRFQQGNDLGKGIARNKPIQGVKQRHGSLSYGCARGAVKPAICETGCSQNRFYFPISLYNNKGGLLSIPNAVWKI
jgi:hypothetical protein